MKPWDKRDPALVALLKRKGLTDMLPKAVRGHPEEDEQVRVVAMLDRLLPTGGPVFWSATLNGVRVPPKVRGRLTELGLRPGVLDLVFIPLDRPIPDVPFVGIGSTFWVELKTDTGRLSPEQKRVFEALHRVQKGQVCRTAGEVEDQIRTWGFIP